MRKSIVFSLMGLVGLLVVACDDETKGGGAATTTGGGGGTTASSTTGTGGAGGTGGSAPTCGPAELCARTIDECMETITPAQCDGFYNDPSNCTDMPGYVSCNCECYLEATCSDYFACGNLCFNDFCN